MVNKKSVILIILLIFIPNIYFIGIAYLEIINESDYEIEDSVTYRVETNFQLYHYNKEYSSYYLFNDIIYNFQEHDIGKLNKIVPYQETLFFSNKTEIKSDNKQFIRVNKDKFDNGFVNMELNFSLRDMISASNFYEFKINNINFKSRKDVTVEDYDKNSNIFKLYCNNDDIFYQGYNSQLLNLSNYIVGNETNPIKIAHKIITWISNNIEYGDRYYNEFDFEDPWGVLETYLTKKGKCKDFSELMVTLLRIQGIPARVVSGIVLDGKGKEPKKGDIYEYFLNYKNNTFTGNLPSRHAWIEYYVPENGWLVCDPTWSDSGDTYFNNLDLIHLRIGAGTWFTIPYHFQNKGGYFSLIPIERFFLDYFNFTSTINIRVIDAAYDLDFPTPADFFTYNAIIISFYVIFFCLKLVKDIKNEILK